MRKNGRYALILGLLCLLTVPVRAEAELPPETEDPAVVSPEPETPEEPTPTAPPEEPTPTVPPEEPVPTAPPEEPTPTEQPEEPVTPPPAAQPAAPVIVSGPGDVSCKVGGSAVLRVEAYAPDGGSLSYQWYRGAGSDRSTMYPLQGYGSEYAADTSASGVTYYYVLVGNSLNGQTAYTESRVAAVNVSAEAKELKPEIRVQPKGAEMEYGERWTLSVKAECPGAALSYQWYVSDSPDGSNASPMGMGTEQEIDSRHPGARYYFVRVSAFDGVLSGEKDSRIVCVRIGSETPRIVTPPQSVTVRQGERCTLTVEAELTGKGRLSYIWYQSTRPDKNTMTAMTKEWEKSDTLVLDSSRPSVRYYYVKVISEENGESSSVISDVVSVQILGEEKTDAPAAVAETTPAPTEQPPENTPEPLPPDVTLEEEAGEVKGALPVRLTAAGVLGCLVGAVLAKTGRRALLRRRRKRRKKSGKRAE